MHGASIDVRDNVLHAICVRRYILLIVLLSLPVYAVASPATLTRREGFLFIWESIRRSAPEQTIPEFDDVQPEDIGYTKISYARNRGILEEAELFKPEDPLLLEDALLWLMRTRNVEELPDMDRSDLPLLLEHYPITAGDEDFSETVSQESLFAFMQKLDQMLAEEVHEVSYYGDDFHGRGTAFGETFDMNALTAAHRSFPHNTLVKVTNVENNRSVTVRINDRGPYVDGRDMDLSRAAFAEIADHSQGVLNARFQRLGDEEFVDVCMQAPRRFQKRITRDVRFHRGVPHDWTVREQISLGANRFFVVRSVRYPDGSSVRLQDWVGPEERFHFTPSQAGDYVFSIGTTEGRVRDFVMHVHACLGEEV